MSALDSSHPIDPIARAPRAAWLGLAVLCGDVLASSVEPLARIPAAWIAGIAVALLARRTRPGNASWVLIAFLAGGAAVALHGRIGSVRPPPGVHLSDRIADELTGTIESVDAISGGGQRVGLRLAPPARMVVALTVRGPSALLPGDRVRVSARLRSNRGYRTPGALGRQASALAAFGADAAASVDASAVIIEDRGWHWRRGPVALQRRLARAVADRGGDPAGNAVARAVALGDRSGIEPPLGEDFRDGGVAHVLAVSGLHLGMIALLVFGLTRRSWGASWLARFVDPSVAAAWVALAAAAVYTVGTGARVSTVRALVVATIVLLGIAMCRRARFIDALGLAVILFVAFEPEVVFDVSFQLSFAATATLALVARQATPAIDAGDRSGWRRFSSALTRRARQLLMASLWTSLATAPFTALAFHRAPGGGLIVNVLVVPIVELIVLPLTLLGALLSLAWNGAGGWVIDAAVVASSWAAELAGLAADWWPATRVPPPNWIELGAWFACWLAAVLLWRGRLSRRRAAIVIGVALAIGAASWFYTARWVRQQSRSLTVTFLDVGQGDAAVLELPGGAVWLVDAGGLPSVPSHLDLDTRHRLGELPGERSVVPFLEYRRIHAIDRVVLSHPHPDHYRGLRAVAREFPIAELWIAADGEDEPVADPEYLALLDDLRARGTRIISPRLDHGYADHGVTVTALAPRFEPVEATTDPVVSVNDDSLVVRVRYAGRSILFAGDLEAEGEEALVARPGTAAADVVKVAHHGSRTSSSPAFVAAVRPRFAVISCGVANQFGFPAPSVIARWQATGARLLRTDVHGSITVVIDERGGVSVQTVD